MSPVPPRPKLIIGDSACGKTQLLVAFTQNRPFQTNYVPIIFESYVAEMEVDGTCIDLELWDTLGPDYNHDRHRPLYYQKAHVVLVCFSADSPSSLDSVQKMWSPEVNHYCAGVPVILVCCKKDLRHDPDVIEKLVKKGLRPLTSKAGMVVARMIGVEHYMECSGKSRDGVDELFQCAARAS